MITHYFTNKYIYLFFFFCIANMSLKYYNIIILLMNEFVLKSKKK